MLGVEALSEGTADQLFLALRIAAIEEHARRATPLPFIADDLFVTFDEPRTEAALRLLAELGAVTQVIVFTHHEHVVEWGTRALGDGVEGDPAVGENKICFLRAVTSATPGLS